MKIEDVTPMPENVVSHAMFYSHKKHEDGRECAYHVRLDKWVVISNMGLECLREHPDWLVWTENQS